MTFKDIYHIEAEKPYFQQLKTFIQEARLTKTIYPKREDLFRAFDLTPFNKIKVVIIGQDPYHGEGQAHGLCFSVNKGIPLPPSLQNIYKEIESSCGVKMPKHGDLSNWANQGVLLLNTILTVEANQPLSHQNKGWEVFTLQIIKAINQLDQPICFLLFGAHARSFKAYLNHPKHTVLETSHPSPLSNYRGFSGSGVFKLCNEFLKNQGETPIQWQDI
jgi:uracil-DNA glycosylase